MASMIISELLCYVQNNFKNHARSLMGVAISGFFTDDEVTAAKACLFSVVEPLKIEGMPRNIVRKASDLRKKLECDDLLNLYAFVDTAKCQLPTFVAANLKRLPSVTPGEVDVCTMAASVAALTAQMEEITRRLNTVNIDTVNQRLAMIDEKLSQTAVTAAASVPADKSVSVAASSTVSNLWSNVVKKPVAVRVKGSAVQSMVKAVPRLPKPKVLQAFVGRMHNDTTEEELTACLTDVGLEVVSCRRLKPPNGQTFNTAAFYVSCADSESGRQLFYEDSTWPEGAELRDWYNKS